MTANPAPGDERLETPKGAYAAAWIVLACVYTALFAVSGVPVPLAAKGAVAAALPPAIAGLAALDLARRRPWSPAGRWRQGLRLGTALLALTAASTAGWLAIVELDLRLFPGSGRRPTAPIVTWQFLIDFLLPLSASR